MNYMGRGEYASRFISAKYKPHHNIQSVFGRTFTSSVFETFTLRFGGHAHSAHAAFFRCFQSATTLPQARWLKNLRAQIARIQFQRVTKSGDEHDHSAVPLYLGHIKLVQQALAKCGTKEAIFRKHAILTLQVSSRHYVRAPAT